PYPGGERLGGLAGTGADLDHRVGYRVAVIQHRVHECLWVPDACVVVLVRDLAEDQPLYPPAVHSGVPPCTPDSIMNIMSTRLWRFRKVVQLQCPFSNRLRHPRQVEAWGSFPDIWKA